jgi:hypothetical protein
MREHQTVVAKLRSSGYDAATAQAERRIHYHGKH